MELVELAAEFEVTEQKILTRLLRLKAIEFPGQTRVVTPAQEAAAKKAKAKAEKAKKAAAAKAKAEAAKEKAEKGSESESKPKKAEKTADSSG